MLKRETEIEIEKDIKYACFFSPRNLAKKCSERAEDLFTEREMTKDIS